MKKSAIDTDPKTIEVYESAIKHFKFTPDGLIALQRTTRKLHRNTQGERIIYFNYQGKQYRLLAAKLSYFNKYRVLPMALSYINGDKLSYKWSNVIPISKREYLDRKNAEKLWLKAANESLTDYQRHFSRVDREIPFYEKAVEVLEPNPDRKAGGYVWKYGLKGKGRGDIAGTFVEGEYTYIGIGIKELNRTFMIREDRLTWFRATGRLPMYLWHKDGDKSNSKMSNLRIMGLPKAKIDKLPMKFEYDIMAKYDLTESMSPPEVLQSFQWKVKHWKIEEELGEEVAAAVAETNEVIEEIRRLERIIDYIKTKEGIEDFDFWKASGGDPNIT